MREAVAMLRESDDAQLLDLGLFGVALTMALWDERACIELLERTARAARDAGLLRDLDTTLWLLGLVELVRGDPGACGRYVDQVRELRRAIGYDAEQVVNASYLAWAGASTEQVELIAQAILDTGFAGAWTVAMSGLSTRSIADGHYRDAFERLRPMIDRPFLQVTYLQLPDYVEAGARSGKPEAVRAAARAARRDGRGERHAVGAGRLGAMRRAARARRRGRTPLRAGDRTLAAIDDVRRTRSCAPRLRRVAATDAAPQRCPAQLRRARRVRRRRSDGVRRARPTGTEARAAVAARDPRSRADDLTPQEAEVARLAAGGTTNADIGSALFISSNTVDYHLRKVFRKLGVTSRRQLSEHFPDL